MKRVSLYFAMGMVVLTLFAARSTNDKWHKELTLLESFFTILNEHYVDTLDAEKLARVAIDAAAGSLDPYTKFFNAEETEKRKEAWEGIRYSGIGAMIEERNGKIIITEPEEKFPAWKANFRAGDVIKSVDTVNVEKKRLSEVVELLRGNPGTQIKLSVFRQGTGIIEKVLEREQIKSPAVPYYGLLNDSVGYIRLAHFLKGSANDFGNALRELKQKGMSQLVLDMRYNSGGVVEEALRSLCFFLPEGLEVCSLKGKHPDANYSYFTQHQPYDTLLPVAIITNGSTISAAEIFAGAMQDYDRAVLIGQQTSGKGLVQGTRSTAFSTSLYVTTARYYTPSGRCVQKADYSGKYGQGANMAFPDSLKRLFKTRNGRPVYSNGGIEPDISFTPYANDDFMASLRKSYLVFDFANTWRNERESISRAEEFTFSDGDFMAFVEFVKSRQYPFSLPLEEKLGALEEEARKSGAHDILKKDLEMMRAKVKTEKVRGLKRHEQEIMSLLEWEIIKRYYGNSGNYAAMGRKDSEVLKAIQLLGDKQAFATILAGK